MGHSASSTSNSPLAVSARRRTRGGSRPFSNLVVNSRRNTLHSKTHTQTHFAIYFFIPLNVTTLWQQTRSNLFFFKKKHNRITFDTWHYIIDINILLYVWATRLNLTYFLSFQHCASTFIVNTTYWNISIYIYTLLGKSMTTKLSATLIMTNSWRRQLLMLFGVEL